MVKKIESQELNFPYEIIRDEGESVVRIDYEQYTKIPSIEEDPICMAKTIEILAQVKNATKIIFAQRREYEYDYVQTRMLTEIAEVHNELVKERDIFDYSVFSFGGLCKKEQDKRYNQVQKILYTIKSNPIEAYVEAVRLSREVKIESTKLIDETEKKCSIKYLATIMHIVEELDKTRLITVSKPYLAGYDPQSTNAREIYKNFFKPYLRPDFMFTKLMAEYPVGGEEIDSYMIDDETEVKIFSMDDNVKLLYHINPPEFQLTEDEYEILDLARKIMAEHKPKQEEFTNPERMREVFFNVGKDLIEELCEYRKVRLTKKKIESLTNVLVRYTIGFGLIEILLKDENIQDISVNAPLNQNPIFVVHGIHGDCETNIIPATADGESWASKLRMMSGRPLDEADPILDTEMELPGASTRVSVISKPLNPLGLAFSFRRHRDRPWTLPLFIKVKMLNPLAAGLLGFLIDGTRTLLVAGTRSSGKSSFLGSLMISIMRKYRIITIEDTLELPTRAMRNLGFNVQPMKVASALTKNASEVSASDGIRSTLRLGDSSLIVGEVRSKEAISLYEAMRVGAAANVVAGTIHSDSPYGVFDRVVNDIGVPPTSFKATDIIIIAAPIKSADGMHRVRRITQITEVRKGWEKDPLLENGFVDLMKYDSSRDELVPTDDLLSGNSDILKLIASNIPDFVGDWDAVWGSIELRAKINDTIVQFSDKLDDPEMLEAPFVIKCYDAFHIISEQVKEKKGTLDSKRIYSDWLAWLKRDITKKQEDRLLRLKNK